MAPSCWRHRMRKGGFVDGPYATEGSAVLSALAPLRVLSRRHCMRSSVDRQGNPLVVKKEGLAGWVLGLAHGACAPGRPPTLAHMGREGDEVRDPLPHTESIAAFGGDQPRSVSARVTEWHLRRTSI